MEMATKAHARKWTPQQEMALELLANPFKEQHEVTHEKVAEQVGVARETVTRWCALPGWDEEQGRRTDRYIGGVWSEAVRVAMVILRHGGERAKVGVLKIVSDRRPLEGVTEDRFYNVVVVGGNGENALHQIRAASRPGAVPSITGQVQDTGVWREMGQDNSGGNGGHATCDWDELWRAWVDS